MNVKQERLVDEIIQSLETDYFKLELPRNHYWDYLKARVYDYKQEKERLHNEQLQNTCT